MAALAEENTQQKLPFKQLSSMTVQADIFQDFPTSLMRVGKTSNNGHISIFTSDGVTVHKEQDVLITCKGKPIFVGILDEQGRSCITLIIKRGQ